MAQRKRYRAAFKARVAVEAIAGHKTVSEIAAAYQVHPSQVGKWKAEALQRLPEVLDWFSRYVLSWSLSTTLEAWFCFQALRAALRQARPGIFNTDQGSQFTSAEWIEEPTEAGVAVSMDGSGRVFDNIFTERLWRSVKYGEVYLEDYDGVDEARRGLSDYFAFYNTDRPHEALDYRTPAEVHFGSGPAVCRARKEVLVET